MIAKEVSDMSICGKRRQTPSFPCHAAVKQCHAEVRYVRKKQGAVLRL
jgi:hypothetical protein